MTLDTAEPDLSVIVTGQGSFAQRQAFGEHLLGLARGSRHSAELIVAETSPTATVEEGIVRAVARARGKLVAFCDPASGLAPETLTALVASLADGFHDLAIAVCGQGQSGAGPATIANRFTALLARLILWPVAQTRDPWSRWYALRRDQLLRLAPADRASAAALYSLLFGGPEMRSIDVSARPGPHACPPPTLPTLREILAMLRRGMFAPEGAAPTVAKSRFAASIGITVDLVATLALLAWGWLPGASNLAGFGMGAAVFLAARVLWPVGPHPAGSWRLPGIGPAGWHLVVAALALGLRGGAVATALAYGVPPWLAATAGVGTAWSAGAIGNAFVPASGPQPAASAARRWSVGAAGIVLAIALMHLFYIKVLPLTPEEAYYWNYSIRLDFGYLDHPPLVAWLIAVVEGLFGHGEASIRLAALACLALMAAFAYHLALRLVDRPAALVAAALAVLTPYGFFIAGFMISPDAPLAAAWGACLYFLHRALVGGERRAWYGVGVALGLGLLSKYTIAILGPAALAFCVIDRHSRAWFLRPQPYVAVLIAAALFAPVVYWNFANDWASFRFQGGERFGEERQFSLHYMLMNIMLVATPLPLMVLPLLFARRWTQDAASFPEPALAEARNRLFVTCFVFVPLAVFAWSALKHVPRLNWTGPIWLATVPLLGWTIVRAGALRWQGLGTAMRLTAGKVIGTLLIIYAAVSYHLVLGIPGVPYPPSFAKAIGWPVATRELQMVHARITRETGVAPVIVGMDKYNTASQIAFFGARPLVLPGQAPLKATSIEAFTGNSLMFNYWDPPGQFRGRTLVMVARNREALATDLLASHFGELDATIHTLRLANSGPGGNGRRIADYFYRIGHDYRPPPGER
jgi:dolichol-phosphate mannosyltransferase